MLFNSLDYALFLAGALTLYWVLRADRLARIGTILVLSCIFYAAWNPAYLGLILFTTSVDWLVARQIERTDATAKRKRWLAVSIILNLGLLGFFKYWNFFAANVDWAFAIVELQPPLSLTRFALPVGISFYTFESISYCVDVYRGHSKAARTPLELLFFITFFPKLVAGPIARPAQLLSQLEPTPSLTQEKIGAALSLIARGLIKKVAFADYLSVNFVDRVFDTPGAYSAAEVVVALYGFTLQIYMDFSGYTDIARGSAKLFDIELPENFDRPYAAQNPAEFWRRWHMSLSTWLRDYLYFPLGGSKLGERRTYFNLWLTIFLIGLWHGASWNFVCYGAIQATAVAMHRLWSRSHVSKAFSRIPAALWILMTMQLVVFSRILFRATDWQNAVAVWQQLGSHTYSLANVAWGVWIALGVGFAAHYTPRRWYEVGVGYARGLPVYVQGIVFVLICFALMRVAGSATVPYIYFQF